MYLEGVNGHSKSGLGLFRENSVLKETKLNEQMGSLNGIYCIKVCKLRQLFYCET